jgi:hypothetical protein
MTIIKRMGQSREQRDRRAERHYRRREADRGHEHRTDRPAGIVAETLAGAADAGRVEFRHERAHWGELHQDRSIERNSEEQKTTRWATSAFKSI